MKELNAGVQALRGIAALMVFVHHLPWLTSTVVPGQSIIEKLQLGAAGVYVFFALSGYLMTYKVTSEPVHFLTARLRRIFPAYWLSLLVSAVIMYSITNWWAFDPRLLLLYPAGEIMATKVPYWTLVYEASFYALVFAIIIVARKRAPICIGAALAASYILAPRPYVWADIAFASIWQIPTSAIAIFFLAGVIVGQLPRTSSQLGAITLASGAAALFWLPVIGSAIGVDLSYPRAFSNQGALMLAPQAVASGLALMASLSWQSNGTTCRTLGKFGDWSYGIYLIHIPVLFLVAFVLQKAGAATMPYYAVMIIMGLPALVLSSLLGWLDWAFQKFIKRRKYPIYVDIDNACSRVSA